VNQLPKSVVREIRTPRSVGAGGGRPPPATRWDGKRSVAEWPKLPRPSSTLPQETSATAKDISLDRLRSLPSAEFTKLHCRILISGEGHAAGEFIAALGGAAAWPIAASAQQPTKVPTIGFLGTTSASAWKPWTAAFVDRLGQLGWIDEGFE
jgi:hypothetical protein